MSVAVTVCMQVHSARLCCTSGHLLRCILIANRLVPPCLRVRECGHDPVLCTGSSAITSSRGTVQQPDGKSRRSSSNRRRRRRGGRDRLRACIYVIVKRWKKEGSSHRFMLQKTLHSSFFLLLFFCMPDSGWECVCVICGRKCPHRLLCV